MNEWKNKRMSEWRDGWMNGWREENEQMSDWLNKWWTKSNNIWQLKEWTKEFEDRTNG